MYDYICKNVPNSKEKLKKYEEDLQMTKFTDFTNLSQTNLFIEVGK